MRRLRLTVLATGFAVVTALGLTACAPAEPIEVSTDTVVIDVRTPEEYAGGHLDGAVNVNLQSGSFEQDILEFPLEGDYVLYCRSGNRSAQAAAIMADLGFTNVQDAGSVQSASSATGIPIVTD